MPIKNDYTQFQHQVCCVQVSPSSVNLYMTNIHGNGIGLAMNYSDGIGRIYAGLGYTIFVGLRDIWNNPIIDKIEVNSGMLHCRLRIVTSLLKILY